MTDISKARAVGIMLFYSLSDTKRLFLQRSWTKAYPESMQSCHSIELLVKASMIASDEVELIHAGNQKRNSTLYMSLGQALLLPMLLTMGFVANSEIPRTIKLHPNLLPPINSLEGHKTD